MPTITKTITANIAMMPNTTMQDDRSHISPLQDDRSHISPLALLRLQSWLSPAFPIGTYSYSHGICMASNGQKPDMFARKRSRPPIANMNHRFPDAELCFFESDGDNDDAHV